MKKCCIHSLGLFLLLILSGCAFTTDKIGLNYTFRGAREKVPGAENIRVEVKMTDHREVRDSVGRKINGWGSETADIVSTNDVVELVKSAVEKELAERGFAKGDAVVVSIELNKFYNRFKAGFWAGDSFAQLILNVQVRNHEGGTVYAREIRADGLEPNIQVASGYNAKASLEQALSKGITDLFDQPEFIAALAKAAGEGEAGAK